MVLGPTSHLLKRRIKGGETVTGNSYFYTFCTFLALPVVKDAQTNGNETSAKC